MKSNMHAVSNFSERQHMTHDCILRDSFIGLIHSYPPENITRAYPGTQKPLAESFNRTDVALILLKPPQNKWSGTWVGQNGAWVNYILEQEACRHTAKWVSFAFLQSD